MRVGIFGGTFDPIHNGHLIIARTALSTLPLDKVLFIPAASPPHKIDRDISLPVHRCRLVEAAITENSRFELSRIEFERPGPSYMVDTLAQLDVEPLYRSTTLFLIIGADNYLAFSSWRDPERILSLARLAVYPRYSVKINDFLYQDSDKTIFFDAPKIEISSSGIRDLVRSGKSITHLVPWGVEKLIMELDLYRY